MTSTTPSGPSNGHMNRCIRERLVSGPPIIATFNLIDSTDVVEAALVAGFDTVIVDLEHGAATVDTLTRRILAGAAHGADVIVRVPRLDANTIGVVLDAGAAAVLVPHVESAQDAHAAVDAAFFGPIGHRGANPFVRAADFHGDIGWFAAENDRVTVMAMIEGASAIADIASILSVEHLGAAFLGPFDLSHALGVPGQVDHPTVVEAMEGIIAACALAGVASAVFAPSAEMANHWLNLGVSLVALGVDSRWVRAGLAAARDGVRVEAH